MLGDAPNLLIRYDYIFETLIWFPDPNKFIRCVISEPSENVDGNVSILSDIFSLILLK
jgi:hypothetical protein